jgi:hypothetical protein
VGTRVGRYAWEAVYSVDSARSKPSSAVPNDDCEAASTEGTNGSLKASRKMNRSFELLYNFPFLSGPTCKRIDIMC